MGTAVDLFALAEVSCYSAANIKDPNLTTFH